VYREDNGGVLEFMRLYVSGGLSPSSGGGVEGGDWCAACKVMHKYKDEL
jgi:hypothetical protein